MNKKQIIIFTTDKDKEFEVIESIKKVLLENKVYYQVHDCDKEHATD